MPNMIISANEATMIYKNTQERRCHNLPRSKARYRHQQVDGSICTVPVKTGKRLNFKAAGDYGDHISPIDALVNELKMPAVTGPGV